MKQTILITGGGRSGKSRHALKLAADYGRKAFIATSQPIDEEMRERIEKHRKQRGQSFLTIEEPLNLAAAVRSLAEDIDVAVIDCLTVWLGNLMHQRPVDDGAFPEVTAFIEVVENPPCSLIIVTNEVGMGIVPANKIARQFRDTAGRLNQGIARLADKVILMISGIPMVLKERVE